MNDSNKNKKMSNEGHDAKVPMGRSIGAVFLIGIIIGSIVVFLAVAGRTEGVIEQRRQLAKDKAARGEVPAANTAAPDASAAPAAPSGTELPPMVPAPAK